MLWLGVINGREETESPAPLHGVALSYKKMACNLDVLTEDALGFIARYLTVKPFLPPGQGDRRDSLRLSGRAREDLGKKGI